MPGPSAERLQVVRVSASQISWYELCPRKWGFRYLDGIKPAKSKWAQRGLDIHKLVEDWLEKGQPIDTSSDYGKIAKPGLRHLPAPKTAHIEKRFEMEAADGIVYVLVLDVYKEFDGERIRVWDHKTTGDFKWVKKTTELVHEEIQPALYAVAVRELHEGEDVPLELNWTYYRATPKRPAARKVQLLVLPDGPTDLDNDTLSYADLEKRFEEIHISAQKLAEHRRAGHKALDLPFNLEGCNAYGGCPFRGDPCKLESHELMRGIMAQQTLLERIKAAKAKKAAEEGNGADGGTEEATTAPAASSQASAEAKNEAAQETAAAAEEAAAAPRVNPPEKPTGGPKELERVPAPPQGSHNEFRASMAAQIASGILARGAIDKPVDVAKLAVETTDAILKRL